MSRWIPRLPVVQRQPYLLRHVPKGARTLHVGCTGWPTTAKQLDEGRLLHSHLSMAGHVTGIDISESGLALLREEGFADVHCWDAAKLLDFPYRDFDCVVASDVIEHLSNPGDLLDGVASILNREGVLLLSTVNAFSFETLLKLPLNWESVHDEHTCDFSYATLTELTSRYGLKVENAAYYHELGWRGPFNSIPHFMGYAAMRMASFVVPHFCSGLILVLRRENHDEQR
jgi:SAM-dependent methyltransferase